MEGGMHQPDSGLEDICLDFLQPVVRSFCWVGFPYYLASDALVSIKVDLQCFENIFWHFGEILSWCIHWVISKLVFSVHFVKLTPTLKSPIVVLHCMTHFLKSDVHKSKLLVPPSADASDRRTPLVRTPLVRTAPKLSVPNWAFLICFDLCINHDSGCQCPLVTFKVLAPKSQISEYSVTVNVDHEIEIVIICSMDWKQADIP
jgi:hypothetical protein